MPKRYSKGIPTSRVIKSRSYVITNARPKIESVHKNTRSTRVSIRRDTALYLAWLDS
jgi:hypothetical protein